MNIDPLERLVFLISCLPDGLRADWYGSNHYELTTLDPERGYWWLNLGDLDFDGDTEEGKRLGLLLDLAEAAKAAEGQLREIANSGDDPPSLPPLSSRRVLVQVVPQPAKEE